MRNAQEVQLAWFVVEFLQTMVDLIWEHYQEHFKRDIEEHERRNDDQPWNF